jgi:F-type H+-transporting ATPase subunit b
MPQLDPTFYPTEIFWLVLTFVPLYFILRRLVLPRMGEVLGARQRHIESDLEKASGLKEEADKVFAAYEAVLAEGRTKAAAIVKKAADEMAAESARRHEAFGQELAAKTRDAEARIGKAKDAALAQVAAVAADAASAATAKLIGASVPADQVKSAVEDTIRGRA